MKDITSRKETEQFFREQNRERFINDPNVQFLKAKGYKIGGCFGCDCKTECKVMKRADKMVKDICTPKKDKMEYIGYAFSDKMLFINYTIGDEEDFLTKEFDLQKFEDWVYEKYGEENDGERVVWVEPSPTNPDQEPMSYSMSLWDYIQENEEQLVKEFFSKNK